MKIFATCAPGIEPLLAQELSELGADQVHEASRGVDASGSNSFLWRANIESRLAERILVPISAGPGRGADQVHRCAMSVDWRRFIPDGATFAIDATVHKSKIDHRIFLSQRVKDGICDQLRQVRGKRPDIDPKNPDVWIRARLFKDRLHLAWDSSGTALHKRGYRRQAGIAPLRETLAAALLRCAGYDGSTALLDPLCGSGTIVIEGAMMARAIPPGLGRAKGDGFAFQRSADFDAGSFADYLHELEAKIIRFAPQTIFGSDRDAKEVVVARSNARAAGVGDDIRWGNSDFLARTPLSESVETLLVGNPPYGERMNDRATAEGLLKTLGDHLKSEFTGHRAALILGDPKLVGAVGLRPTSRLALKFAKLDARIVTFDLYEGSQKTR